MFEFYVAGVQHHEIYKCLKEMGVGQYVVMEPEPTNKYDLNAIRLEYSSPNVESVMIGYVPAKISADVSAMLEIGDNVSCRIIELNKDEKPWKQVKVAVEEVD